MSYRLGTINDLHWVFYGFSAIANLTLKSTFIGEVNAFELYTEATKNMNKMTGTNHNMVAVNNLIGTYQAFFF